MADGASDLSLNQTGSGPLEIDQQQSSSISDTSSVNIDAEPFVPSFDHIRSKTLTSFGKTPCAWQVHVCREILREDRDVISIAGTGMGKTLTFWMPLLFRPLGVQIIVTPLNILGEQNISILAKLNIEAIFISAKTATQYNFRNIASLRYRVIIVNPEELMRPNGGFEALLKDRVFTSHLISIVIDEAHCISQWGSFRHEYRDLGRLRYILRRLCPILATSATMSGSVLDDVKKVLRLRNENLVISQCSTDRPNFAIIVRPIVNPIYTYRDLSFVLGNWKPGNAPPPKFIIFFDNIRYTVEAGNYLRSLLPKDQQCRIKWFNSDMSDQFRRTETLRFASGETWGLLATDSFGMNFQGMDLPDIKLVVQWRAPASISTLWQRFGRCVRDLSLRGTVILLAEKEHFDQSKHTKKRKRNIHIKVEPGSTTKRAKLSNPLVDEACCINEVTIDGGDEGDDEQEDIDDQEDEEDEEKDDEKMMKKSKKRLKKGKIEPAILALLNADARGISCRRQPFIDNFQNNKSVSLHLECDPSQPGGCVRCRPALVDVCCDLHNPELLALYPSTLIKASRQPGQSRLIERETSEREKEDQLKIDTRLKHALETWRRDIVVKNYGRAALRDLGPSLVMGEKVRDRIVDCARHGKIKTVANIERETKWADSIEYGPEILKIIDLHYPSSIVDLTLSQSESIQPLSIQPDKMMLGEDVPIHKPERVPAKRQTTCSSCRQKGHTMRSKKCPLRNGQKENLAPGAPLSILLPSASIVQTCRTPTMPSMSSSSESFLSTSPLSSSSSLSPIFASTPSLSPIFASTLSTCSTFASLSPTTMASLASHLDSITLSRQRNNTI